MTAGRPRRRTPHRRERRPLRVRPVPLRRHVAGAVARGRPRAHRPQGPRRPRGVARSSGRGGGQGGAAPARLAGRRGGGGQHQRERVHPAARPRGRARGASLDRDRRPSRLPLRGRPRPGSARTAEDAGRAPLPDPGRNAGRRGSRPRHGGRPHHPPLGQRPRPGAAHERHSEVRAPGGRGTGGGAGPPGRRGARRTPPAGRPEATGERPADPGGRRRSPLGR